MTRRVPRATLGAWAVREIATFHLERIATAYHRAGLDLMVLKGMWLQAYAYRDPDERPFADLDLLVRRSDLRAAERELVTLGYRLQIDAPGDVARLYVSADGFQIDLHYDLFPDGLFRLRGEHLFQRGLQDTTLASVPVYVPDPYDGFAHLVGHFAKGRHGPSDAKLLRDFEELGRAFGLLPSRAAAHLVAGGLRRAGLYALQFDPNPESFSARTRRALPADPLGQRLVRALGLPRRHDETPRALEPLFVFALDHGLPQGLVACGRRVVELWQEGGVRRVMTPVTSVHERSGTP